MVKILRIFCSIIFAAQLAALGGSLILSSFLVMGSRPYFPNLGFMTATTLTYSWIAINCVAVTIAFPMRLIWTRDYSILLRAFIGMVCGPVIYLFVLWQFGAIDFNDMDTSTWFHVIIGIVYGGAFTVSIKLAEILLSEWWPEKGLLDMADTDPHMKNKTR